MLVTSLIKKRRRVDGAQAIVWAAASLLTGMIILIVRQTIRKIYTFLKICINISKIMS